MNTLEIAEPLIHDSYIESPVSAELEKSSTEARAVTGHSHLRHVLLLCVVAMLGWLAFSVHHTIDRIDAEMDMIRANLMLPF